MFSFRTVLANKKEDLNALNPDLEGVDGGLEMMIEARACLNSLTQLTVSTFSVPIDVNIHS